MANIYRPASMLVSGKTNDVTVLSPILKEECRLTLIGDYHSSLDDERGKDFIQYSARMAQYGNKDMRKLEEMLEKAYKNGSDAVLLLGDILSFPSEKGIETLAGLIKSSPVPVYFTAGNHDWHYEGWEGSDMQQRREWTDRRLRILFGGYDPMNYTVEIKGIKLIMMDNSVYEITPQQLAYLRRELADGKAALIGCHIPFYLGMPYHGVTNFGCGHPQWGEASDPFFEIERRERWAKSLSAETFAFCREVLTSPNVLGIVAGHTHAYSLETFDNKFQLVVSAQEGCKLSLSGGIPV